MCIACSPFGSALGSAVSRRGAIVTAGRLGLGAAAGFGSLLRCAEAQSPASGTAADAICCGGPILTMNDAAPTAEAVAVRAGRILAVGARAAVEATRGPGTRSVDLGGRTMLPGLVDPHGHVMLVGLQALTANLLPAPDGAADDIPAIIRILREWASANAAAVRRYGVIFGFGCDESRLAERRMPVREELDQVSTELPVVIMHTSGHITVANSRALAMANITAGTPDPEGGWFLRREGSREPNGSALELALAPILGVAFRTLDRDAPIAMVRAGAETYASYGCTTAQEGRALPGVTAQLAEAATRGLLPIDVVAYPDIAASRHDIRAPLLGREYRNRLRIGGAKLTIDGSVQGKTAWLTRPDHVPPLGSRADFTGAPTISSEAAFREVDRAFAEGWQLLCHANGDAAIDMMSAAARAAVRTHGRGDRRMVLIHGQTVREDQVDALRELGIIPSLFPMHTFHWGDWHRDETLGPERAENMSPTGWCLARGMIFTTHHDAPVAKPDSMRVLVPTAMKNDRWYGFLLTLRRRAETSGFLGFRRTAGGPHSRPRHESWHRAAGISSTVTRRSRTGDILGPRHRVPVAQALKAMTIWPAFQHFEEAQKGTLEPGKLADFVVLSDNPLTVDPETPAALRVVETIKEGVSVSRA
jgi:predicted amidohydrolase YtcJ